MKHRYKNAGLTVRKNTLSPITALGIILAIAGYLALGSTAKAADASNMTQSKVYLINKTQGTKVDAVIALARDAGTVVYECNKMKLSKKATLKRDNADD